MQEKIFCLKIDVPASCADLLQAFLAREATFGWQEDEQPDGHSQYTIYSGNLDWLKNLEEQSRAVCSQAKSDFSETIQKDWLESWKEFFTPVHCGGSLVVVPPWLADADHGQKVRVIIEPKSAFGTGHHASTVLCLTALDNLLATGKLRAGQTFLDLGCGTGILGIAAAKAGLGGIFVDVDPLAVENAQENLTLNELSNYTVLEGGIELLAGKRFDLVMANILARPLMDMASDICHCLKPDGLLILSGILDRQAPDVDRTYVALGLNRLTELENGEWRALIYSAPGQIAS